MNANMNTEVYFGGNTAIKRSETSKPMRHWTERGLLKGDVLDFGSGHDIHPFAKYDPFHHPDASLLRREWDTVVCSYVLNVQPTDHLILAVLLAIRGLLAPEGRALIAVRNDVLHDSESARGHQKAKSGPEWFEMVRSIFPICKRERTKAFHGFVAAR